MDPFANLPIDPDTRIIANQSIEVEGRPARVQVWVWDGISAMSLIFLSEDVAGLNDDQLRDLAIASGLPEAGSQFTFSRDSGDYCFVNFNFSYE